MLFGIVPYTCSGVNQRHGSRTGAREQGALLQSRLYRCKELAMTAPNPQDLIRQRMALVQELEIAMYSIESGLAVLQRNQAYQPKPRHFTFLLLLAIAPNCNGS